MKLRPAFHAYVRLIIALMTTFAPASDTPAPPLDSGAWAQHPQDRIPAQEDSTANENVPDEVPRTSNRLALAGLGILAGLFGTIWKLRRRIARRRQFQTSRLINHAQMTGGALGSAGGARGQAGARHRVRRFDYDRFYLHLTRDL